MVKALEQGGRVIVWRGAGIVVFGVVFGCNLAAQTACNAWTGTPKYWESHAWPIAAGFLTAASVIWSLGSILERRPGRELVDPATGERVVIRAPHELFFIPVKYWGAILWAVATIVLLTDAKPGPPWARAAGVETHAPSR